MTTRTTNNTKPEAGNKAAPAPKRVTKKDQLIRMLSGKTGAEIAALSRKLGWQEHTTRAALTGLRKAGFDVTSEKPGEGRPARYRIMSRPSDAAPASPAGTSDAG